MPDFTWGNPDDLLEIPDMTSSDSPSPERNPQPRQDPPPQAAPPQRRGIATGPGEGGRDSPIVISDSDDDDDVEIIGSSNASPARRGVARRNPHVERRVAQAEFERASAGESRSTDYGPIFRFRVTVLLTCTELDATLAHRRAELEQLDYMQRLAEIRARRDQRNAEREANRANRMERLAQMGERRGTPLEHDQDRLARNVLSPPPVDRPPRIGLGGAVFRRGDRQVHFAPGRAARHFHVARGGEVEDEIENGDGGAPPAPALRRNPQRTQRNVLVPLDPADDPDGIGFRRLGDPGPAAQLARQRRPPLRVAAAAAADAIRRDPNGDRLEHGLHIIEDLRRLGADMAADADQGPGWGRFLMARMEAVGLGLGMHAGPAVPRDDVQTTLGKVTPSIVPPAPDGFTRTWDAAEIEADVEAKRPIAIDDAGAVVKAKHRAPYLACAVCPAPLRVSSAFRDEADRVWALRCGHLVDQHCLNSLSAAPEDPVEPLAKRRRTRRLHKKKEHTWACPVAGCGREHVSVLVDGAWAQKEGQGGIQVYV